MIDKVQAYVDDYNANGPDALKSVPEFLKVWLIDHINGTDKAYAAHLVVCGKQ